MHRTTCQLSLLARGEVLPSGLFYVSVLLDFGLRISTCAKIYETCKSLISVTQLLKKSNSSLLSTKSIASFVSDRSCANRRHLYDYYLGDDVVCETRRKMILELINDSCFRRNKTKNEISKLLFCMFVYDERTNADISNIGFSLATIRYSGFSLLDKDNQRRDERE
jgi:hypothetical protein